MKRSPHPLHGSCKTTHAKAQEVARAFSKHIKPACIHDHENNKPTKSAENDEWWWISASHIGAMVRPLLSHYTDATRLGDSCFRKSSSSGGVVPVEKDGVGNFFLGPLMSCRLYHEAWFVRLHLEQTGKHRFEQPVLFLYPLFALKRAHKKQITYYLVMRSIINNKR